jgi:hypothetical protein
VPPSPHLKLEADSISETLCFLVIWSSGRYINQRPSDSECYTPSSEPFTFYLHFFTFTPLLFTALNWAENWSTPKRVARRLLLQGWEVFRRRRRESFSTEWFPEKPVRSERCACRPGAAIPFVLSFRGNIFTRSFCNTTVSCWISVKRSWHFISLYSIAVTICANAIYMNGLRNFSPQTAFMFFAWFLQSAVPISLKSLTSWLFRLRIFSES